MNKFIGIAAHFALGWLLVKSDFSAYAFASAVFVILAPFSDQGLQRVLTAQRSIDVSTVRSVQRWARRIASASTILLLCAAGIFYSLGRISEALILATLSPVPLISLASGLHRALLQRRHQFYVLAVATTGTGLIRNSLTVIAAFVGGGFLSFVIGVVASKLYEWWYLRKVRARSEASAQSSSEPSGTTSIHPSTITWIAVASLLTALVTNGDYLLLGILGQQRILADYYFGYQAVAAVSTLLAVAMAGVYLPVIGAMSDDEKAKTLQGSTRALLLVAPPAFILGAFWMDEVFSLLWREKWGGAAIVAAAMLVSLTTRIVGPLARSYIEAMGRWRTQAFLMLADAIGLGATIYVAWLLSEVLSIAVLATAVGAYRFFYGLVVIIYVANAASAVPMRFLAMVGTAYLPTVMASVIALATHGIFDAAWIDGLVFAGAYFILSVSIGPVRSAYLSLFQRLRLAS